MWTELIKMIIISVLAIKAIPFANDLIEADAFKQKLALRRHKTHIN